MRPDRSQEGEGAGPAGGRAEPGWAGGDAPSSLGAPGTRLVVTLALLPWVEFEQVWPERHRDTHKGDGAQTLTIQAGVRGCSAREPGGF